MPGIYAIPGTNHAIVIGDSSNNLSRQYAYAQTAIDQTILANAADTYALGTDDQTVDNNLLHICCKSHTVLLLIRTASPTFLTLGPTASFSMTQNCSRTFNSATEA
jgi:hypothetical protein